MYTPHWERPNTPTSAMSTEEMRKYYKSRNVAHTCEFWLSDAAELRADIRDAISALLHEVAGKKEKPSHKQTLEQLRRMMTTFYTLAHGADYWAEFQRPSDYTANCEIPDEWEQ